MVYKRIYLAELIVKAILCKPSRLNLKYKPQIQAKLAI